jgi:hypothetical protein
MSDVTDRPDGDGSAVNDSDGVRILDDSPLDSQPYRLGDEFLLYHDGASVRFKVTEIVERGDRRITYGVPVT